MNFSRDTLVYYPISFFISVENLSVDPEPVEVAIARSTDRQGESASYLLAQEDAFIWGTTVTRWSDGKYHAYSARWPRAKGFPAWLTDCTVVHSVADRPEGPYRITGTVLESRNRTGWDLVNAHNPDNERFLMIMKGDAVGKQNWHRIQLVGTAESAAGPFQFQNEPVYAERQTEDACIWYNQNDGDYNMVCHVMGQPDLARLTPTQCYGGASRPGRAGRSDTDCTSRFRRS